MTHVYIYILFLWKVELFSAVSVVAGAIIAIPTTYLATKYGHLYLMVVGGVCIALTGFLPLFMSDAVIGRWQTLIPYLVLFGAGRSCWVCLK